jgi:hypothetical protein
MRTDLDSQRRIDVVCQLRSRQLRAWKKYSLDRAVSSAGCIRPEAYSSCSTIFREFQIWWCRQQPGEPEREAVVWIIEIPTDRNEPRRSLVAKLGVRQFWIGGPEVPPALRRYVRSWTHNKNFTAKNSTVAEADPDASRFYPANDLGRIASQLRYVKKDGSLTQYSTAAVLRIHPEDVCRLTEAADATARRSVFVSYKHADFEEHASGLRPCWRPEDLARLLIRRGFGVWLDSLCALRRGEAAGKAPDMPDWTDDEVGGLLAEGHAQSQVVLAIVTPHYDTPGVQGTNWTRREYAGEASMGGRTSLLHRFVLHGPESRSLEPVPDDMMPWPDELGEQIADRIERLCG